MGLVVWPVFHRYPIPPEAVSAAVSPGQMVAGLALAVIRGRGFTQIEIAVSAEHPPSETCTLYVTDPVAVGVAWGLERGGWRCG